MASIPCPTKSDRPGCPCDDNPLANLSSELSDGPLWFGYDPVPPIYQPPAGNLTEPSVPVFCVSTESQAAADECASNGSVPSSNPPPQPQPPTDPNQPPDTPPTTTGDPNIPNPGFPVTPQPTTGFWNTESNCIALCADHSNSATAIIPAHTFSGTTQAEADMLSSNACIALARDSLVCIDFPGGHGTPIYVCNDEATTINMAVSGPVQSVVLNGLPPGMSYSLSGGILTLTGTPSACGNYNVTMTITNILGEVTTGTFAQIRVLGATCPTDHAVVGSDYSASITPCGGVGPYEFDLSSSTIGDLYLDQNGHITGFAYGNCGPPYGTTRTIPYTFRDLGASPVKQCSGTCVIDVDLCGCINWGLVKTDNSAILNEIRGSISHNHDGGSFAITCSKIAQNPSQPLFSEAGYKIDMYFAGGQSICKYTAHVVVSIDVSDVDNWCEFKLGGICDNVGFPVSFAKVTYNASTAGIDYTFYTYASDVNVYLAAQSGPNGNPSAANSSSITVTISPA